MQYVIGLTLSLAVAALAVAVGFDRERAFYPTVLIVVASYYVLFAAMGASNPILILELIVAATFLLLAIVGYKKNLWLVALAIAGHGIFDVAHPFLFQNPGVPSWWPGFCATFDVVFGSVLIVRWMRTGMPTGEVK
jgi:hypothetical protein